MRLTFDYDSELASLRERKERYDSFRQWAIRSSTRASVDEAFLTAQEKLEQAKKTEAEVIADPEKNEEIARRHMEEMRRNAELQRR